jgi:hypothetical protein
MYLPLLIYIHNQLTLCYFLFLQAGKNTDVLLEQAKILKRVKENIRTCSRVSSAVDILGEGLLKCTGVSASTLTGTPQEGVRAFMRAFAPDALESLKFSSPPAPMDEQGEILDVLNGVRTEHWYHESPGEGAVKELEE